MYEGRCYRFTVTPFGLSTSSAALTRGLDVALEDEIKKNAIIYVDDCLCYSNSIEAHLKHLEALSVSYTHLPYRRIKVSPGTITETAD